MLKALTCIFVFFTFLIFSIVNVFVRKPYMDEIFHYPQALKYYNGSFFEWDPKITTPPGLYLSSVTILIPLSKLIEYDLRKIEYFRITNLFFTFGNFFLLYKILCLQHLKDEERFKIFSAMNISMFPVLYFFTFLYYTDCGSVFFVLLMYYWNKKYCFISAAIAGALSIFFRQTNIVWVF
ncbi:putative Dol-P-Glc:Glc(2)Man(9)GlcNAc(2)-PP-Dol alpha-1,2-glucosyltransferase, partial [Stegodyphus mimosarum]